MLLPGFVAGLPGGLSAVLPGLPGRAADGVPVLRLRFADDPLVDDDVAVALTGFDCCGDAAALFVVGKRHLFAFSPRLRIRRDVGDEALRADAGVDLEVRRAHDVLFFFRLRVAEERLLALLGLELARTLSSSSRNESANLSTSVVFAPPDRAEPRFEPRFLRRLVRFEPLTVSPSPLSLGCAPWLVASSAG